MSAEKVCLNCGKIFIVKNSKRNTAKFCSYKCMGEYKAGTRKGEWVTKVCPCCGKEFDSLKSRNKKYCSQKCAKSKSDNHRVYKCDACGKEIVLTINAYNKIIDNIKNGKMRGKYCCKECSNVGKHTGKTIICAYCGKEFYRRQYHINRQIERDENQFCSNKCMGKYKTAHSVKRYVCASCHKIFYAREGQHLKCCSKACAYEYAKTKTGVNNPKFKGIVTNCKNCGKEIVVGGASVLLTGNFCSYKCSRDYLNRTLMQTEEIKEKSRKRILKEFFDGTIGGLDTAPQLITNSLLDDLHISYEREKNITYYAVDNYLSDFGLFIEVQGDYWHSNPIIFNQKINSQQYRRIPIDKSKHTYIKNKYGKEVLYLWESDLHKTPEKCKLLISLYIKNKGLLGNYNSFNYYTSDTGELLLKASPVLSYQEQSSYNYKKLLSA